MRPILLHVALTFDENYWARRRRDVRSICLASRRPADPAFHLIHTGLGCPPARPARRHCHRISGRNGAYRPAHPAYRAFVDELPIGKPFTPIIYARLLLRLLAGRLVERVIYIDSDTFVRGPIEELAELDPRRQAGSLPCSTPAATKPMLGCDFRQNGDLFDFHRACFPSLA